MTDDPVMHSPGPWKVMTGEHSTDVYSVPLTKIKVVDDKPHIEGLVALVYGHHDAVGNYSLEANRKLIAAAPDLLAALQAMMRYYDTPCGPADLLTQANAAIAKATR
jgi:hypothetical protein